MAGTVVTQRSSMIRGLVKATEADTFATNRDELRPDSTRRPAISTISLRSTRTLSQSERLLRARAYLVLKRTDIRKACVASCPTNRAQGRVWRRSSSWHSCRRVAAGSLRHQPATPLQGRVPRVQPHRDERSTPGPEPE